MKIMIFFCLLFSQVSIAASEKEFSHFMNEYLKAIHKKDKVKLKSITSEHFYNLINKHYLNNKKIKQSGKFKPGGFDLSYKKSKNKGQYLLNIKDKKKKEYSHSWYLIKESKNKFIIEKMVHLEETK